MNKLNRKDPESVRTLMVDLTFECPRGDDSEACTMHEKRKMPFTDRLVWVESLSEDDLVNIYSAHCECLKA